MNRKYLQVLQLIKGFSVLTSTGKLTEISPLRNIADLYVVKQSYSNVCVCVACSDTLSCLNYETVRK